MAFLHLNLKALVIAVASGAVAGALSMLMPGIHGSRFEDLFIASVFAVCATFAERRGWKGRLLAIPLWFFAWGAVTVALFSLGSGWIALGILTGLATVLAGLMAIAAHDDAQRWAKAPEAFLRAKDAALLDDRGAMWMRILESFHVPATHTFPPEVCAHDIEVLRFVRAQAPTRASRARSACSTKLSRSGALRRRSPSASTRGSWTPSSPG